MKYDWSALLTRRIVMIGAVLVMFPGSCFAMPVDRGGATFAFGLLAFLLVQRWIRGWRCPRCREPFAGMTTFPYVRPFRDDCLHCGLPGFTPKHEVAPPARQFLPRPLIRSGRWGRVLADRRARVALLFAVPLIWMTMCRLPSGERVRTTSGKELEVLGIIRNTRWRGGGERQESLILSFYAPPSSVTVDAEEVLALALPAVAATGDSIVALNQLRGDWWARAFGLRVSLVRSYALRSDGSWIAQ